MMIGKKGIKFWKEAINSQFQFSKGKKHERLSLRNIHEHISKHHYLLPATETKSLFFFNLLESNYCSLLWGFRNPNSIKNISGSDTPQSITHFLEKTILFQSGQYSQSKKINPVRKVCRIFKFQRTCVTVFHSNCWINYDRLINCNNWKCSTESFS